MTCVDLNSRQLASFPTYGVKDQTPFALKDWSLNPEPSLYSGWSDFMHQVVNCLQLRGEAFQYCTGRYASEVEGVPGRVARFVNLNPDAVGVEWIDGRMEYLIDGDPVADPRRHLPHPLPELSGTAARHLAVGVDRSLDVDGGGTGGLRLRARHSWWHPVGDRQVAGQRRQAAGRDDPEPLGERGSSTRRRTGSDGRRPLAGAADAEPAGHGAAGAAGVRRAAHLLGVRRARLPRQRGHC